MTPEFTPIPDAVAARQQTVVAKASRMFLGMQELYDGRFENASFGQVLPNTLAHLIASHAANERATNAQFRPYSVIESNLLQSWEQRQEVDLGLRPKPKLTEEQVVVKAIEIFGGSEGFNLIERALRKMGVNIPDNPLLNMALSSITTEALLHFLIHEKSALESYLAQASTRLNPEGLYSQLTVLADKMT